VSLTRFVRKPLRWPFNTTDARKTSSFYATETDITVGDEVIWKGQCSYAVVVFLHDFDCGEFDKELMVAKIETNQLSIGVTGYFPEAFSSPRGLPDLNLTGAGTE